MTMSTLRKIFIVLAVSLLLISVIGLFLPSERYLERSITIYTPPSVVFEEVNSLRRWEKWSPWRDIDPNAVAIYEGPEAGIGCAMSWDSPNPKVGKGIQRIVVSEPNQRVVMSVDFADWDGTITAGWKFEEQAEGETRVTWSNHSDNRGKLLSKYMDLIIYPGLGKNYEQGLKNLKAHAEHTYAQQRELQEEMEDEEIDAQATQRTP
jgi:Polyketide cyclase / dehydrase and lipid transport